MATTLQQLYNFINTQPNNTTKMNEYVHTHTRLMLYLAEHISKIGIIRPNIMKTYIEEWTAPPLPYTDKPEQSITIINPYKNFLSIQKQLRIFWRTEHQNNFSIALTEHINHKIDVYKLGNKIVILTNEYGTNLLNKIIAVHHLILGITIDKTIETILKLNGTYQEHQLVENEEFIKLVTQKLDIEKIRMATIVPKIKNYLDSMTKKEKHNIEYKLESLEISIKDSLKYLKEKYEEQRRYQQILFAITHNIDDTNSDILLDYLLTNKYINHLDIQNETITLLIDAPLVYLDEEVLQKYINNPKHIINTEEKYQKTKMMWQKIINKEWVIHCSTAIEINLSTKNYRAATRERDVYHLGDKLPQPHLVLHNCWGNNASVINKALVDQDFLTAINQMIAATQNINMNDSYVFQELVEYLHRVDHKRKPTIYDKINKKFISIEDIKEMQNEANKNNTSNETNADATIAGTAGDTQELFITVDGNTRPYNDDDPDPF